MVVPMSLFMPPAEADYWEQPTIRLLIVTSEDLLDDVAGLVEWKNRTGMPAMAVSWESLVKRHEGADVPESLKMGIAEMKSRFNVDYVMLLGDDHVVPVRFQITDRLGYKTDETNPSVVGAYYPCDAYYADLYDAAGEFDDWDYDENGFYGELLGDYLTGPINHDRIDYFPDVALGRVPASNASEVRRYVEKVIHYESTGAASDWMSNSLVALTTYDFTTFNEAALPAYYDYNGAHFLNGHDDAAVWRALSSWMWHWKNYTATPDQVKALMSQPGLGLIAYFGHGGTSFDDYGSHSWMCDVLECRNLTQFSSENYPIVFSTGCDSGRYTVTPPYMSYVDVAGVAHNGTENGENFTMGAYPPVPHWLQPRIQTWYGAEIDCLPEHSLVSTQLGTIGPINSGFIAYIAGISGMQEWAGELEDDFLQAYFSWDGRYKILGNLWMEMMNHYLSSNGFGRGEHVKNSTDWSDIAAYHQPMKLHLFGDPSLRIGGLPHSPPTLQKTSAVPTLSEGTPFDVSSFLTFADAEGSDARWRFDRDANGIWDSSPSSPEWLDSPLLVYPDDYSGRLLVQASDGEYFSQVVDLDVIVGNVAPSPAILCNASSLFTGKSYRFDLSVGDPGADLWNCTVNFGDGSGAISLTTANSSMQMYHHFSAPGRYLVEMSIRDDDGGTGYKNIAVDVTADPSAPVLEGLRKWFDGQPFIRVTAGLGIALAGGLGASVWFSRVPVGRSVRRLAAIIIPVILAFTALVLLQIIPT